MPASEPTDLTFRERPAAGTAEGLLILHHGRGADEADLLTLGDVVDPEHRLHVVTPRAPLTLDGWPGYHWYVVPRVGHPDPATFQRSFAKLAALHDHLWERTGIAPDRTVLGGFSMGAVMSYALGLGTVAGDGDRADGPSRPSPAGIVALSGFIPVVEGWQPDLAPRAADGMRLFVAHGRNDRVIEVGFARRAVALLEGADLPVEYHESDGAHQIEPAQIVAAQRWLRETIPSQPRGEAR